MKHLSLHILTLGLFKPDFILGPLYYDTGVTNTASKGNITLVYVWISI